MNFIYACITPSIELPKVQECDTTTIVRHLATADATSTNARHQNILSDSFEKNHCEMSLSIALFISIMLKGFARK